MNFVKNYKYQLTITLGLIAVFFIFQNATCSNGSSSDSSTAATATSSTASTLTVTPSTVTVAASGVQQFTVTGGSGNYTYSTIGGGTISQNGYFVAPTSGSIEVAVLDNTTKLYGYALVTVSTTTTSTSTTSATVTLTATSSSIVTGATSAFTATGGTAPYTFYVISGGGGFPTVTSISSSTGAAVYTAPANTTTAQIYATDVYSNSSNSINVVVAASTGTTTASTAKIISVTANSTFVDKGTTHSTANLLDKNTGTYWQSTGYTSATPTNMPYLMFNLGDSVSGKAGIFTVNHLYLTERSDRVDFPTTYVLKAQNVDGSGWTTIGTFTTQPDFDGVARITFSAVTTNVIAMIPTAITKDGSNTYYFCLSKAGF